MRFLLVLCTLLVFVTSALAEEAYSGAKVDEVSADSRFF
jgi:hypothetical protein